MRESRRCTLDAGRRPGNLRRMLEARGKQRLVEGDGWDAPGAGGAGSLADSGALACGVHGLLSLLAASCGGSLRLAASLLGRDARTFSRRHEMPSLSFVADLGSALGMDAASALSVVAQPARGPMFAHAAPACPAEAMLDADLHDDMQLLASLAEEAWLRAANPSALSVAEAACARGAVAEGAHASALRTLARLDGVVLSGHGAAIAACAACEALLAEALLPTGPQAVAELLAAAERWLVRAARTAGGARSSRDLRGLAQSHALEVVRSAVLRNSARDGAPGDMDAACAALRALDRMLDALVEGATHDDAIARIWCASVAGESSCVAIAHAGESSHIGRLAVRIAVRASFMLDEAVDMHAGRGAADGAARIACGRRARLAEREGAARARSDAKCAEIPENKACAGANHDARRDLHRVREERATAASRAAKRAARAEFTQLLHRSLDSSSGRVPMQAHVPCLRSGVASAGIRSESRC